MGQVYKYTKIVYINYSGHSNASGLMLWKRDGLIEGSDAYNFKKKLQTSLGSRQFNEDKSNYRREVKKIIINNNNDSISDNNSENNNTTTGETLSTKLSALSLLSTLSTEGRCHIVKNDGTASGYVASTYDLDFIYTIEASMFGLSKKNYNHMGKMICMSF